MNRMDFLNRFLTGRDMDFAVAVVLFLPSVLLTWRARKRFESIQSYFLEIPSSCGKSGRNLASRILEHAGIGGVKVVRQSSDPKQNHYHPAWSEIALTGRIFTSGSVGSLAVAAHEAAHADQFARGSLAVYLHSILQRVASISTNGLVVILLLLCFESMITLTTAGIWFFAILLLRSGLNLLMEYDTDPCKLALEAGLVKPGEVVGVNKVLRAAFDTYVAATLQAGWGVFAFGPAPYLSRLIATRDLELYRANQPYRNQPAASPDSVRAPD